MGLGYYRTRSEEMHEAEREISVRLHEDSFGGGGKTAQCGIIGKQWSEEGRRCSLKWTLCYDD